jgi:hypothetical protein
MARGCRSNLHGDIALRVAHAVGKRFQTLHHRRILGGNVGALAEGRRPGYTAPG